MPFKYIKDDIFKEHRVEHQLRILNELSCKYDKDNAKPSIFGVDLGHAIKKFPIEDDYIVVCPTNSHVSNKNHRVIDLGQTVTGKI
mgnify:CR=1 FL=1